MLVMLETSSYRLTNYTHEGSLKKKTALKKIFHQNVVQILNKSPKGLQKKM